jgi:hypothetical protein
LKNAVFAATRNISCDLTSSLREVPGSYRSKALISPRSPLFASVEICEGFSLSGLDWRKTGSTAKPSFSTE